MTRNLRLMGLSLLFAMLGTLLFADEDLSPNQRFAKAISLQVSEPGRMIDALRELANDGDARAMDRLAFVTFKGIGTEQSVEQAVALYNQAIQAGRTSSLVSLGKVHLSLGDHQLALDALEDLKAIDRLLGKLSSKARAAFLHNRLDGMGHAEIAERLGVSVSRVRQYIAQGMRQCYVALYGEPT